MNRKKIVSNTFIYIVLVLGSITMLVPFVWMFLTAFKTTAETMQVDPFVIVPAVWQTQNFGNVIKAMDFVRKKADEIHLDPVVLATRSQVKALLSHPDDGGSLLLQGWRRELIGEPIVARFAAAQ